MAEKVKCYCCEKQASWVYDPHACRLSPEYHFTCDEHVPRGCIVCNGSYLGNPEDVGTDKERQDLWEEDLDEQGRKIPCIEWSEEIDGFDLENLSWFDKCEFCK